jgi:hypothetical protein
MADENKYPNEVTIKIRAFPYYVDIVDPVTGREVRQERIAERGDTVNLSDTDYERAQRFNAIQTDADVSVEETGGSFSVETSSVADVANWISEEKPTVSELVEAANEDPVTAQKILAAEDLATGQQPRSSLVDKLGDLAGEAPTPSTGV